MSLVELRSKIPDYAKDIRLNLGSLMNEDALTPQQKLGAFLASAYACGNQEVIRTFEAEAIELTNDAKNAAKAAAAVMSMNNVYYRATHIMACDDYSKLPANLRMNKIGAPGVDKIDIELWSIAISAINGCAMCLDAHERIVRKAGLTTTQIQAAIRIGAVVNAASVVMSAQAA